MVFGTILRGNFFRQADWRPLYIAALALLAVSASAVFAAPASARSVSVYTMVKVRLDASAGNAVEAKKLALLNGPLQALKAMFRRIAPFAAYDRLDTLTANEADDVIEGYAVRSERNSSTRYIALIDYSFSARKMQHLMTSKGIPFFDGRARKLVVMPVLSKRAGPAGQAGPDDKLQRGKMKLWWKAWVAQDLKHSLSNSHLYKAKSADQKTWQTIVAGDPSQLNELRQRYGANRLLLVEALPNAQGNKINLRIFGRDAMGPIDYTQEIILDGEKARNPRKTYESAARIAFGIIEGRWREPRIEGDVVALAKSDGNEDASLVQARLVEETVFLRVAFSGLRDWQQTRAKLQRIPGVRKMQVNSLSPRGADVRISYPGGVRRLQAQLSSYGFSLEQQGKDLVLRSLGR